MRFGITIARSQCGKAFEKPIQAFRANRVHKRQQLFFATRKHGPHEGPDFLSQRNTDSEFLFHKCAWDRSDEYMIDGFCREMPTVEVGYSYKRALSRKRDCLPCSLIIYHTAPVKSEFD